MHCRGNTLFRQQRLRGIARSVVSHEEPTPCGADVGFSLGVALKYLDSCLRLLRFEQRAT